MLADALLIAIAGITEWPKKTPQKIICRVIAVPNDDAKTAEFIQYLMGKGTNYDTAYNLEKLIVIDNKQEHMFPMEDGLLDRLKKYLQKYSK